VSNRRKQFGAYLASMRRKAKMSRRQLAERLCTLSRVTTITRNEISPWERGKRIPESWLPFIGRALGLPIAELEQAAAYARGDSPDWDTLSAAETLGQLLPPEEHLLGPLTTHGGRRIGAETVDRLAGRVHGLRLADDVLAGGDLIAPAFRELNAAVRLYRETSHTEEVSRALLVQIGELAQIAGWIASDAGQHERAEQANRLGISAAREARDRGLVGNLAGSLAYQLSNTGQEAEGVALARAAHEEAGQDVHPAARALSLDRLAWAHAQVGEAQSAMRALGEAHDALTTDSTEEAPGWAYWVSDEELRVMDARVYTELRRPLRAVPLLTAVLDQYTTSHTREFALYLSWLAVALVDANEPEEAAATAARVLDLSADVASERTAERSRVVLAKLEAFRDVPEAREVLERAS
jgi:transcriptional regulator with XRE-family HTH domain